MSTDDTDLGMDLFGEPVPAPVGQDQAAAAGVQAVDDAPALQADALAAVAALVSVPCLTRLHQAAEELLEHTLVVVHGPEALAGLAAQALAAVVVPPGQSSDLHVVAPTETWRAADVDEVLDRLTVVPAGRCVVVAQSLHRCPARLLDRARTSLEEPAVPATILLTVTCLDDLPVTMRSRVTLDVPVAPASVDQLLAPFEAMLAAGSAGVCSRADAADVVAALHPQTDLATAFLNVITVQAPTKPKGRTGRAAVAATGPADLLQQLSSLFLTSTPAQLQAGPWTLPGDSPAAFIRARVALTRLQAAAEALAAHLPSGDVADTRAASTRAVMGRLAARWLDLRGDFLATSTAQAQLSPEAGMHAAGALEHARRGLAAGDDLALCLARALL